MKVRITIVKCDRCQSTIDTPSDRQPKAKLSRGKRARELDLCDDCAEGLEQYFGGRNLAKMGRPKEGNGPEPQELVNARTVANQGLERYAEGATADQLASVLRDVITAANRR